MQRIEYSVPRLALMMAGGLVMTMLSAWAWWRTGGIMVFVGILLFGGAAGLAANALRSGRAPLRFDREQVEINSLWRSASVSWGEIQDIRLEYRTVRVNFIPVYRIADLVIAAEGGMFGSRRHRVPLNMMAAPGGAGAVVSALRAMRIAVLGEVAVAMRDAPGNHGWGAQAKRTAALAAVENGFDPDEAIARYLAEKSAAGANAPIVAPAATTAPENSLAAAAAPARTPRPVFGRRTA